MESLNQIQNPDIDLVDLILQSMDEKKVVKQHKRNGKKKRKSLIRLQSKVKQQKRKRKNVGIKQVNKGRVGKAKLNNCAKKLRKQRKRAGMRTTGITAIRTPISTRACGKRKAKRVKRRKLVGKVGKRVQPKRKYGRKVVKKWSDLSKVNSDSSIETPTCGKREVEARKKRKPAKEMVKRVQPHRKNKRKAVLRWSDPSKINSDSSVEAPTCGKREVEARKKKKPVKEKPKRLQPSRKCKRGAVPKWSDSSPITSDSPMKTPTCGKREVKARKQKKPPKEMAKRVQTNRKNKRKAVQKWSDLSPITSISSNEPPNSGKKRKAKKIPKRIQPRRICKRHAVPKWSSSIPTSPDDYNFSMIDEQDMHHTTDGPPFESVDENVLNLHVRYSEVDLREAGIPMEMEEIEDLQVDTNNSATSQNAPAVNDIGESEGSMEDMCSTVSVGVQTETFVEWPSQQSETAEQTETTEGNNNGQKAPNEQQTTNRYGIEDFDTDEMRQRWEATLGRRRSIWTIPQRAAEPQPEPEPIGDGHHNIGAEQIDYVLGIIERQLEMLFNRGENGEEEDVSSDDVDDDANNIEDMDANEPEPPEAFEEGNVINGDGLNVENIMPEPPLAEGNLINADALDVAENIVPERAIGFAEDNLMNADDLAENIIPDNDENNENYVNHAGVVNADQIVAVINTETHTSASNVICQDQELINTESGVASEGSMLLAGNGEELQENTVNSSGVDDQNVAK